jgi:hypothetical protein
MTQGSFTLNDVSQNRVASVDTPTARILKKFIKLQHPLVSQAPLPAMFEDPADQAVCWSHLLQKKFIAANL